jgi:hypothetical protein
MKLNKKSWHYRLADLGSSYLHHEVLNGRLGLCAYFWRVIWGGFIGTLVVILGAVALQIVISTLVVPFFLLSGTPIDDMFIASAVVGGAMTGGVLLAMGIVWCGSKLEDRQKQSEPSLISQRIAAHKNKVCPIMYFEEDNDDR